MADYLTDPASQGLLRVFAAIRDRTDPAVLRLALAEHCGTARANGIVSWLESHVEKLSLENLSNKAIRLVETKFLRDPQPPFYKSDEQLRPDMWTNSVCAMGLWKFCFGVGDQRQTSMIGAEDGDLYIRIRQRWAKVCDWLRHEASRLQYRFPSGLRCDGETEGVANYYALSMYVFVMSHFARGAEAVAPFPRAAVHALLAGRLADAVDLPGARGWWPTKQLKDRCAVTNRDGGASGPAGQLLGLPDVGATAAAIAALGDWLASLESAGRKPPSWSLLEGVSVAVDQGLRNLVEAAHPAGGWSRLSQQFVGTEPRPDVLVTCDCVYALDRFADRFFVCAKRQVDEGCDFVWRQSGLTDLPWGDGLASPEHDLLVQRVAQACGVLFRARPGVYHSAVRDGIEWLVSSGVIDWTNPVLRMRDVWALYAFVEVLRRQAQWRMRENCLL